MRLDRRAHRVRVPGFRFAGVRAGLKTRGPDVALIALRAPGVATGVLTTNRAPAAPVIVTRARLRAGAAAAVLVHAGNANACTGAEGRRTVEESTAVAAALLGVAPEQVLACATGRIGVQVPRERLLVGVRAAHAHLSEDGFADAARAITTTDAFPKTAVRRVRLGRHEVTVAVMGKGAGMIAPDLATLLVFACTDARIEPRAARAALDEAVAGTLNAITVDGDMSTNDTLLLLSSGAAGNPPVRGATPAYRAFVIGLTAALEEVARLVVLDGEGASRLVEVHVTGAASDADARRVARAIATSTLCKCAFAGGDPNWGRFVCAAGTAGVALDPDRIDVVIDGVVVSRRGRPIPRALSAARRRMAKREFRIELALRRGRGRARVITSDLTVDYVHFNAAYTT
jgi:glutamate N-acetyltransferase / amino-acid N-acetyltransferase